MRTGLAAGLGLSVMLALAPALGADALAPLPASGWTRAAAARLLDRAGFGGRAADVARLHARGLEGAVDWLLEGDGWQPLGVAPLRRPTLGELMRLPASARQHARDRYRIADRARLDALRGRWVGAMLAGRAPLRERLALLWHSAFAIEHAVVDRAAWCARNAELLRRHAFDVGALLAALPRDPAVLEYLDNRISRAAHPNENFARELLELYTIGDGRFSEADVRAVARAFAGWTCDEDGAFAIVDPVREPVVVLGRRCAGGDAVVALLRAQPATGRRLARRLVRAFVGRAPALVAPLAKQLTADRLRLRPALRRLLRSQAFYAAPPAVAPALVRVVRQARALGLGADAGPLVAVLARDHVLYAPPSVAGWPEPREALSTASVFAAYEAGRVLALADRAAWRARALGRIAAARREREAALGLDERTMPGRELQRLHDQIDAELARRFPGLAAAADVTSIATPTDQRLLVVPLSARARRALAGVRDPHRRAALLLSTPEALLH